MMKKEIVFNNFAEALAAYHKGIATAPRIVFRPSSAEAVRSIKISNR